MQAGAYEATRYCIENYGSSRILWEIGPETEPQNLPIEKGQADASGEVHPAMTWLAAYPRAFAGLLLHNGRGSARAWLSRQESKPMKHAVIVLVTAAILAVSPATATTARPSLRDVPEIENPLFAIVVAYVIGEQCPTITARRFKGLLQLEKNSTGAPAIWATAMTRSGPM
ncbi:DUF5333 family protein [Jhaorihella thermophila]